jgi:endoglycosylceramidase
MWLRLIVLLVVALLAPVANAIDARRLHVVEGRLVDGRGREITLRGVNARAHGVFDVTFDDGRLPLQDVPFFDAGDAERMQALGFDLLRLPINWSALEPRPGFYDAAYLDRIEAIVDLCAKRDILVLIDFHQDAFSKEIGQDGAPRWVLDLLLGPNGYPYLGGPLGDLAARRVAPETLNAFRMFFDDVHGVQDLMAQAAAVVATRFRRNKSVLGYEVMNEPLAAVTANGDAKLRAFTVRVAEAIRRVDRRHLVVFEPDTIRNFTNAAPIPSAPFAVPGAIYAPHIYTGVFDGTDLSGGLQVLTPSMERAAAEAAAWGVPLLVGEYGIDPSSPYANAWIRAQLDLQDRLRAHSAFWVWEEISEGRWGLFDGESSQPGGERLDRTHALSRVYARAVPGRVLEHTVDDDANTLRLRWQGTGGAKLELYVPKRRYPGGVVVRCNGVPVTPAFDPTGQIATLGCGRGAGERLVELAPAS